MDSLTQLALGGAIGEATLGRKVGYRAALWGGIIGTLPDLDGFVPFNDAIATMTYHRTATHSLIVLTLLTPIMVWLIQRIHPQTSIYRRRWLVMVFLVFATHVLLDSFTVYGTQLFWPVYNFPFSWSTIFSIDPAYTLPILIGVICALIMTRSSKTGHYINLVGLFLSTLYLMWSVVAKSHVESVTQQSLQNQNIFYNKVLTTPSLFNTFLWRIVVMGDKGYYEGYYSVFDKTDEIIFIHYPSDMGLLRGIENHWPVQRLQWFTHGFYSVSQSGNAILLTDLRMGFEPYYAFRFKVAELGNPHPKPLVSTRVSSNWQLNDLYQIWWRLIHPQ